MVLRFPHCLSTEHALFGHSLQAQSGFSYFSFSTSDHQLHLPVHLCGFTAHPPSCARCWCTDKEPHTHARTHPHRHAPPLTHKWTLSKTFTPSLSSHTHAHTNRKCLRSTPTLTRGLRGQRTKPRQLQEFSTDAVWKPSQGLSHENTHAVHTQHVPKE